MEKNEAAALSRWSGCFLAGWLAAASVSAVAAPDLDTTVADPELKVRLIDSDLTESFISIRLDTEGRIFVGGREALFVYEVDPLEGYAPRRELYRFPNHTWIYDIELRGDDVYVLTLNALYLFPKARVERGVVKPRRLLWGLPPGHVHQCFHGLAWGPEGDLYISTGDPLWYYGDFTRPDHWGHWTFFCQPEGTRVPYNGVGGIFRCRPDGSRFQVVARGVRNSCGLAFDRHWNLFANDNDHESIPAGYVPGRLLHVTPRAYFSWPRGWMVHKQPGRADLLETMNRDMGRAVPVGQTYYDESFLPEKYRNSLLVARWGVRSVSRYPLKARGASFTATEQPFLVGVDQARPVGVAVGRGGRVFATISKMAHSEGSPTYPSDLVMVTRADDPESAPFEGYDVARAPAETLWAELSRPSWWRRYRAHVEIHRRGGALLKEAASRLEAVAPQDPAGEHIVWLAAASRQAEGLLGKVSADPKSALRLQALRALGEFERPSADFVAGFVADSDPQVRHAALVALFACEGSLPKGVVEGPEAPARSDDTYLRQIATLLLAERASLSRLENLCQDADPATRLAGVLAAGFRLTLPPATAPVPEDLPLSASRVEHYMVQFADARIDLRELGRVGNYTVAEHWKARAHSEDQERLFTFLLGRVEDPEEKVRIAAAHFLQLLDDSRSEPLVKKVFLAAETRRLDAARLTRVSSAWLAGPFSDGEEGFGRSHPPEFGPVDLAATYTTGSGPIEWKQEKIRRLFNFRELYGSLDGRSVYAFFRLDSFSRQPIQLLLGSDDGVKVWHNRRLVWSNDVIRAGLVAQDLIRLELEPGSNYFLVRVRNESGESGLYVHYRALGKVTARLPESLSSAELTQRLRAAASNSVADAPAEVVPEAFLAVDWAREVAAGDVTKGANLYEGLGCLKCHAAEAGADSGGAPSLSGAVERFTVPHLIESILLPSRQVSPIFRATTVVQKDGQVHSGLVVGETSKKVTLLLSDASRREILHDDVLRRDLEEISPMPGGLVKTPEELRDLMAYLLAQ